MNVNRLPASTNDREGNGKRKTEKIGASDSVR
jgi:hypothetical protein